MVKCTRPVQPKPHGLAALFLKGMAALIVSAAGFAVSTSIAHGPGYGDIADFDLPEITASIAYNGNQPVIEGSVADVFHAATFAGPNRDAKRNRLIPTLPDVMSVAATFDVVRKQIGEERHQEALIAALRDRATATGAPIDVASNANKPDSAALKAISAVASLSGPVEMPNRLAYARANADEELFKKRPSDLISKKEISCLETAIYFEARGESYRGQAAVAQVVMNRVKHKLYPNTICGVVFQNQSRRNACQFSFACDGIPERVTEAGPWKQAEEIAKKVLDGELYLTEVANATHYHASYVYPKWAPRLHRLAKIGLHIFYRFKNG